MNEKEIAQTIWGNIACLVILGVFVLWMEIDKQSLHVYGLEDGPIESASSLLFFLSSIGFVVFIRRSEFLRTKKEGLRYLVPVAWALLMFVFAGEEISWGQRILGFGTPNELAEINALKEFNVHNIAVVDSFMGGKYRYLSIMMLITGLVMPLFVLSSSGKRLIQWFAYPVTPLAYSALFVGAYIYGKYYVGTATHPNDPAEVREFLMSVAMCLFAWHGAMRPPDLFRVPERIGQS